MSRTDLDAATIANALRRMAGDGSVEWVTEPIQTSVLLDVADALDENAELRELVRDLYLCSDETCTDCKHHDHSGKGFWCKRGVGWKRARMRELGVEVDDG